MGSVADRSKISRTAIDNGQIPPDGELVYSSKQSTIIDKQTLDVATETQSKTDIFKLKFTETTEKKSMDSSVSDLKNRLGKVKWNTLMDKINHEVTDGGKLKDKVPQ